VNASPRPVPPSALRIAIDYNTGVYPGAGVARYTRSLVDALTRRDRTNQYALFYGARGLDQSTEEYTRFQALLERRNVEAFPLNWSPRQLTILWQRMRLPMPIDGMIGPLDVIHAPDFVAPPRRQGRVIITIHDLSFLIVPQYAEPSLAAYLQGAVPRAIRKANIVIAVSETTRQDLITRLRVPPAKVITVPNGVDTAFRPLPPPVLAERGARLRARLRLPPYFILHVGTLEPRKNLVRLIDAYYTLVAAGRAYGHALVLAGRKGWLSEPIFERVQQLGLQDYVRFLDYVPEADLPTLYNMASVFAYPSLYEGFGLPVAEAMACGVPTLTARAGATEEIAGDSALLVDPQETSSIAAGLEMLLERPDVRTHYAQAGVQRATAYSWDETAQQVLGLYEHGLPGA
jgi:glycosyltransferase involved in cell wall biosynthesis